MEYEEEQIYGDEINAYLRAGGDINNCLDADGKFNRNIQDPIIKFQCYVTIISSKMIESGITITTAEINEMVSSADKLQHINYKNPTAYILGYLVSSGGTNISQRSFNYIKDDILPKIDDKSIKLEDIIRYGRLWLEHL